MRGDRRDYEKPRLREFGPVGVLTQGGTGLSSEAMAIGMFGDVECNTISSREVDPRC